MPLEGLELNLSEYIDKIIIFKNRIRTDPIKYLAQIPMHVLIMQVGLHNPISG